MSSGGDIILQWVAPIIGNVLGICMFGSPILAVHRARKAWDLGLLNPIPFAVTWANCAAWTGYGFASKDVFMFPGNVFGFVASTYTCMGCLGLATRKMQNMLLWMLCSIATVTLTLGLVSALALTEQSQRAMLWGVACNTITIMFYASPLTAMWQVIRTRNAASIHLPMVSVAFVNTCLWVAYGVAVKDIFVWLPNGLGALLSIMNLVLCAVYPRDFSRHETGANDAAGPSEPISSNGGGLDARATDAVFVNVSTAEKAGSPSRTARKTDDLVSLRQ